MNNLKYLSAVILLVSISILFAGCKQKEPDPSPAPTSTIPVANENLPTNNLINVDVVTIDTIVQQNYNLAKVKAEEWKPDAVLVTISVKFPQDLAISAADETFIFGSAEDTVNWWSFSISEKTSRYIRAIIPKEDYLGVDIQPINMDYWKMNYSQAFQLAEANGGQAFRSQNTNASITATLHHTQPRNWLWWEIEYKFGTNKLVIKVNPNDGQIVDETGNPLSTGGTTPAATTTTTPQTTPVINY
ncbi:MAG: hypothetical protein KAW88_10260 [Candidatus Cloacimonetes bacterium]|nr:hypothetical protein [Candidatus Cloacimonadota bacterium]